MADMKKPGVQISKRIQAAPSSPIRRLEPFAAEAKKKGVKVYPLHIGQPDIETPSLFFEALNRFDQKVLAYGPSIGDMKLIEVTAAYYAAKGIPIRPADVLISDGGSEALSFAVTATCDPGDEILIPEPFFPGYTNIIRAMDVVIVPISTEVDKGYHLPSFRECEAKITPKTRAILLSHPGNPTGVVYTPEEVERIADLAVAHNLFVISDEVYREFVYDASACYRSFASLDRIADRVIIVDSISKRFSACGARVGCIVSRNPEVIQNVVKLCQGRSCPPVLEQIGARALYEMDSTSYLKKINDEYSARRDTLYNLLIAIEGVVCRKPEGAFYIMAKLPVDDAEKFVLWMLQNFAVDGETVMGAPGEGFYATPGAGRDEMRFAYVLKKEDLIRAASLLRAGLEAYPGRIVAIKA
ncbi:MAG: pyridoxal phosphate-dependent aminotransferase [Synergistaceae bacterium]|jgi:aspartate aminotransferase|nr:pyridoxal phosphate-dependent aminotransferase [Synergistaceae bacterium]